MKATNEYGQPAWITEPISPYQIASILEGENEQRRGRRDHEPLDGGSYMPAITYSDAREVMEKYGDEVLEYLQVESGGHMPRLDASYYSWVQIPCFYLSRAVLLWCQKHAHLADWEDQTPARIGA